MTNKTLEFSLSGNSSEIKNYLEMLYPSIVIQLFGGAVGVVGNVIVLIMYTRYITDKKMTRYFIPILALVDLIGCLSNVIFFCLDNEMRYIFPGVYLVKVLGFLIIMFGGFSAHLIFAIALQRYLIICRPFGQQMTRTHCRIVIFIIFVFTFGYATPAFKFTGFTGGHIHHGSFRLNVMVPYFGVLLFFSFSNIFATICVYIRVTRCIFRKLSLNNKASCSANHELHGDVTSKYTQKSNEQMEMSKKQDSSQQSNCSSSKLTRKQTARKRITNMFLVIIIVYVVSNMTSLITTMHAFVDPIYMHLTGFCLNIYVFCLRLNLLNHIVNPYIYWFYDIEFRMELSRLCCKRY